MAIVLQSDGYWVDGKSNRKVKLPEVNFHELCQRELDALASIAIDRINKNPAIPDVKIKYKKTGMAKIARKLSALSHHNQQEQEFVSLFGMPISRVVERDTLKRIQNQNAQNNTAFILRRKSSTITRQRRCIENSDSKLAQDNVSSQVQINEGKATLDKSIIQAEKSDCEATTRDVRRRSYNPLSRRSGLSQLHMNEEETDLLYALSSSEIENGHGLPRNNSKHSSSNNPYHRGSLTNSNGSFSFKKSEIPYNSKKSISRKLSSPKFPKHQQTNTTNDILVNSLPMVPAIIVKCCDFIIENGGLEIEGIFRVSGSAVRLKKLRETFEVNIDYVISTELYTVMDVSSLLKDYIRSLPEPLIPAELFSAFTAVNGLKHRYNQLEHIVLLLSLLPAENRDTLEAILKFLTEVIRYNEVNKMGINNLATIFAPCFLKPPDITKSDKVEDIMQQNSAIIGCTTLFIEEVDSIFTISAELHNELIRRINETDCFAADILIKRKTVHYSNESILSSPDKRILNSSSEDLLDEKPVKVEGFKETLLTHPNKTVESGFES